MATKNGSPQGTTPCPFTILIDKQEKIPYSFEGIASNADTKGLPFAVTTRREHLQHLGDYSIEADLAPWELPKVMVERKSAADLYGSVTDRDNFEWRLNRLDTEVEFAVVVVESELSGLMTPPTYVKGGREHQHGLTFKSLHATIQSWQMRFQRVHWMFYPDRESAELGTFWYLYRFYEGLAKHKLDRDRKRLMYKAYYDGLAAGRKRAGTDSNPHPREHAVGDLHDYWLRGYLDHEALVKGKAFDSHEMPLVPPPDGNTFEYRNK